MEITGVTISQAVACVLLYDSFDLVPCYVLQIGSAIWAFTDAKQFDDNTWDKAVSLGPQGPWTAAWGMLLFWPLFFPWYLANRNKAIAALLLRNLNTL
jgi:hypothetical protein